MAETPIPITPGTGGASVASDLVSGASYQQIKVVDGTLGSNTALIVNADGTANVRISGSVATAGGTFTGSVSGTVGASIIGIAPVFIVGGSIAGTFTTPNQSVSGTVGASVLGAVPVVGATTGNPVPAQAFYIAGNNGGFLSPITTVLNQADGVTLAGGVAVGPWVYNGTSWDRLRGDSSIGAVVSTSRSSVITVSQGSIATVIIGGSIAASFTPSGNQSVSGTVGASVIGAIPIQLANSSVITVWQNSSVIAVPTGNQSVSGAVSISNFPASQNVSGSVVSFQGTNPWVISSSIAGGLFPIAGSVAATVTNFPTTQNVSGSVVATQGTTPWVSAIQGSVATVIIGGSIAASFTPPANQSVSGTVNIGTGGPVSVLGTMSVLGTVPVTQATSPWIITGSVQGSFSPAANQSVSGTVGASIIGVVPVSLTSVPPQSVSGTVGASIIGQLPAGTAVLGSVAVLQGSNPWIETFSNSSILAVPVGSTLTIWQSPSIAGTYAEDSAAANTDRGLLSLHVRNDTLSSVTNADGDYSALSVGPSGEVITANAPLTKWVQGTADFRNGNAGGSIVAIAAQGASIFTYITAIQVVNMGSASVLVTLAGTGSTLGYTIAPAGGGSNIYYPNGLKGPANATFAASLSGIASVLVSAQGFTAKI